MDKISPERRSANMRAIRSSGTSPELVVRRLSYKCGFRHRLHRKDLPGKPDIVYPSKKAVVFVHGCFWHMHGCEKVRVPKSNTSYWSPKLQRNKERDRHNEDALKQTGWRVLTIWECETADVQGLEAKLRAFLS